MSNLEHSCHTGMLKKKKEKKKELVFPYYFFQMFQIQIQNTEKIMQMLVSVNDPTPFLQCFILIIKNCNSHET